MIWPAIEVLPVLQALLALLALIVASAVALVTVWTDWRYREVANAPVLVLLCVWCLAVVLAPQALGGTPLAGLVCGASCLAVGFALYAFGWVGGGDGKLLAVLALWLGPYDLGFGLLAASALMLLFLVPALAGYASVLRSRGIPVACALAPAAAVLLAARAVGLNG